MLKYISADFVMPVASAPIENGVIAVEQNGTIAEVLTSAEAAERGISAIVRYEGLLVPGFINTHCHLELSHLRGQIPRGTGLPKFVEQVIKQRTSDPEEIDVSMQNADAEMFRNGIVAVGDISNQPITAGVKAKSPIHYHTFIELLGFHPDSADTAIDRGLALLTQFAPQRASLAPHAPYSVSPALFARLKEYGDREHGISSMHNQETQDETSFFERKTGGFLKFFEFLGLDITFFQPSGKSSLQSVLPLMSDQQRLLLVHNVFTTQEDLEFASAVHPDLYWCLCPSANLYIESNLPDVALLQKAGIKITLGTDSLASNDRLSIFAEMQILQGHFKVPLHELLRWATCNGAEFLGITDQYGSLAPGKRPGINLLEFTTDNGSLLLGKNMRRLF